MKKTILAAISATALVALAACTDEGDDTTIIESDAEEGMTSTTGETTTAPVEGVEDDGDSFRISEDGVEADINDGDTRVRADIDEDPTLEVND